MAVYALSEPRDAAAPLSRPVEFVCFALIVAAMIARRVLTSHDLMTAPAAA